MIVAMRCLALILLVAGCTAPPELNFSDYQPSCANNCADRHRECLQKLNPMIGDDFAYGCRRSRNECLEKCPRESKRAD